MFSGAAYAGFAVLMMVPGMALAQLGVFAIPTVVLLALTRSRAARVLVAAGALLTWALIWSSIPDRQAS